MDVGEISAKFHYLTGIHHMSEIPEIYRVFCVFLCLLFISPIPLLSIQLHISWDIWKGIHNFIILLAGLFLLLVRKGKRKDFTLVFICRDQWHWLQQLHFPVFFLSRPWESFSLVRLKSFGLPFFTWASYCFLICEVLAVLAASRDKDGRQSFP